MAINNLSEIIEAVKLTVPISKNGFTMVAGRRTSLFTSFGSPTYGTTPSSGLNGDTPDDSMTGSLVTFTNPTPPVKTYLGNIAFSASLPGLVLIYDRIWQNIISPTATTLETIVSGDFPRAGDYRNVELFLSVYVTMGAGSPTITIGYTNENGVSGRTGTIQAYVTAAPNGSQFFMNLASGDRGVKSVQSVTKSATMTSGTIGLVARRLLAAIPLTAANIPAVLDPIQSGMSEIPNDAFLEMMVVPQSTGFAPVGMVQILQG